MKKKTICHIPLGSGLAPDCSRLSGREKPDMYETHKSREAKRNLDISMPLHSSV